jgi:phosphoglycerol transferase
MQGATAELKNGPARAFRRPGLVQLSRTMWLPGRADLIGACVAAIGAILAAGFSLQLWRAHLHVPFDYSSDGLLSEIFVKSVISGGWVWHLHGLGAPFGNQLFDFPIATDDLNFLTMKLLGIFSSDPAKVLNVWFLLTFPAVAVVSYAVLRKLGVSLLASIVCAVLFADSPYHLLRGAAGHYVLSEYCSVPVAAYMIVSVLDGRSLFQRREGMIGLRSWVTGRNLLWLVLCVMIGSLGVYYASFTMVLMAVAGAFTAAGRRGWTPLLQAIAVIVIIAGTSFANDLPAVIYRHEHGTNALVADRNPAESELYALKLVEMVLPVPEHRISALSRIRYKYDSTTPVPSESATQSLGIVSTIGLAWLFIIAFAGVLGFSRAAPWFQRQRQLAFAALTAFLVGTLGGLSAIFAYLFTSEIRGWDRISIFIAFFSIAAVGLGMDAFGRRLSRRARFARRPRAWALAGLAVVLVVGIYDQSSREAIPKYEATGVSYNTDAQFVEQIQHVLPPRAMILQLPYVPFPENPPVNRMIDYDLGRGWVHTTDGLQFSYGAMKGRTTDWQSATAQWPVQTLLDGAIASGFQGLWIDRYGYADNGVALEQQVQSVLGSKPMVSREGRLAFYDLRPYAARLRANSTASQFAALKQATLYPATVAYTSGFYPPDSSGGVWTSPAGQATVDNTSRTAEPIVFSTSVQTKARGRFTLRITAPGGTRSYSITHTPRLVRFTFDDPPGTHPLSFSTNAPASPALGDPRALALYLSNPIIGRAGLEPFVSTAATPVSR